MVSSDEFCNLLKETRNFDDLEIKILRAVINLEKERKEKAFTANTIAAESSMSVTNAYKYLYSLQQKGIVESSKDKNKIFWLSRSSNPFPRLFSLLTKEYIRKKGLFNELAEEYSRLIKSGLIWNNERVYENYKGEIGRRAAFLIDAAKEEVLITCERLYDDVVILDAIRRAVQRGISIRIISEQLYAKVANDLKTIGIEMRLGQSWPYVIVVDGMHGMTVDGNKGLWFLNYKSDYKRRFENFWDKADQI